MSLVLIDKYLSRANVAEGKGKPNVALLLRISTPRMHYGFLLKRVPTRLVTSLTDY